MRKRTRLPGSLRNCHVSDLWASRAGSSFAAEQHNHTMQTPKRFKWGALGALLLAAGLAMPDAQAQSADALLDKLVEKGVLTVREANDLREQADADFNKAFGARTGMPDWVSQFRIYGDVRGRYEMFRAENESDGSPNAPRDRFRYRLRVGATATMLEDFEAGFRITSSESQGTFGGDPISGNTTFQDNGSKKFVFIDLAYGKWTPIKHGPWLLGATIGKMENPFVLSDMVFDGDYTPEGLALQGGYTINDMHGLKLNAGYFVLDEISGGAQNSDDPAMLGAQVRWDAKWSPHLASTLGAAWLMLSEKENLTNNAVPNVNVGNTRIPPTGILAEDFAPLIFDASLTYTLDKFPLNVGPFPIRVGGEYMHNPRADSMNDGWWAGIFFGKSGKRGTWELSYRYKRLEADAWYEEFVDSDFGAYRQVGLTGAGQGAGYRSGTGTEGHIVKLAYSPSDSFTIGATWFYVFLIDEPTVTPPAEADSAQHRVQLDAVWKF